jgi:hypothetical protein
MVTKYVQGASFEAKGAGPDEGPGDPETNLADDQILHALEISPLCHFARPLG